ncbi:MAG: hypothetical protein OES46_02680 [Gammaproteobacteria bacterium]|nr:hypothetical protein [Gammaproteobacteria bacterium]
MRQQISVEAARIMSDEGVRDFQVAKRKAAERLNIPDNKHMPTNQEVEEALREYLELFHAKRLSGTLETLRRCAIEAMRFLADFKPRLVGSVLSGIVTPESRIQIHVSADTPEDIGLLLDDHNIPFEENDKRLRYGGDRYQTCPVYCFSADNNPIEVYVFDHKKGRETPLSPVDGRPMKRATTKEVEELLNDST